MGRSIRVLIVEDDERDAELVLRELRRGGFDVTFERVDTSQAMTAALERQAWDVILSDFAMPTFDARSALSLMRGKGLDLPFIIVSGTVGEETAVEAMRAGAHDYFLKSKLGPRLHAAIERELREAALRRDHREGAAQLRESKEKLDLLLSASDSMLYSRDVSGDFAVSYMSRNSEKVVGHSSGDFFAKGFWQSNIHPADLERVLGQLRGLLEHGATVLDYRFRHKNGSWRMMKDEVRLQRGDGGEPVSLLGTWTDVTEQQKVHEQLMISDRMVSLGTLAAGVAHEINNPLASVMANLELASRDVAERAEELGIGAELGEVREELDDAREGAQRIRSIVRDLKIFSRSEEEKRGVVDVERVLDSAVRMAWNEIKHRARLVRNYGRVPRVEGSDSRLGQVFLNLVVNAAQAIVEGNADNNEIRVSTFTDEADRVVIEVADTGPGIAADVLGRLFTPFFTTKPVGVGTGLGLSICHRIVTDLGGSIDVESVVGEGTVFRVSLPPAPPGLCEAQRPAGVPSVATRRGKILVVDDEPMIATVVKRTLGDDHEVVTLLSGQEALDRIGAGERFDVLLCDMMMPQMTGMELHAELLRVAADQAERMIFLTGGAFTPHTRQFLDAIPNQRVEKPFDPANLRALINDRIR